MAVTTEKPPPVEVTPENVLRVRAALLAESDRLHDVLAERGDWVGLCGGDPLSADARTAFNRRIGDVVAQCRRYADQLRAAGESLARAAREYGYTEERIAASYRRITPDPVTGGRR